MNVVKLSDRKMSRLARITLHDDADTERFSLPYGTKLIEPHAAVEWVAYGSLETPGLVRPWDTCTEDDYEREGSAETAKMELATEIITSAVQQGRLHCVYVTVVDQDSRKAEIINPAQFEGVEVGYDWDNGFRIFVHAGTDDGLSFDGFLFFWDQLLLLRPDRRAGVAVSIPARNEEISAPRSTKRGRPSGRYGAPFAAFCAEVIAAGPSSLLQHSDAALAAMLFAHYDRLGISRPNDRNADEQARAAVTELAVISGDGKTAPNS